MSEPRLKFHDEFQNVVVRVDDDLHTSLGVAIFWYVDGHCEYVPIKDVERLDLKNIRMVLVHPEDVMDYPGWPPHQPGED